MVFGGLGVMLYGGQAPVLSLDRVMHKVDLQSVFFATMFVIILLVLAYLTNPSETSFRTYLTEQSFRQHLSRLEDSNQEDQSDSDDSGVHFSLTRRRSRSKAILQSDLPSYASTQPFHFVNRAAVSLRTPKHVFYSFGVMTIAAVLPSGASTRTAANGTMASGGFMVSESWFIGAFGKWWRGGPIQAWWVDSVVNAKDTERCNSGVLDMKPLDALECYDVSSSAPAAAHLAITNRDSPSKIRGGERPLQRQASNTPRSTTPPPLPKSASLPLHVARVPHDKAQSQRTMASATQQPPMTPVPDPARHNVNPPQLLPSPSTIFDQSPVIADILRQITSSKLSVHDLRTQLKDARAAATESHASIQRDLDEHREKKRSEDAAKSELKSRTKILEDSKRTAEASKREAEKRLRAAETARDSASERIGRLDKEIGELKVRMEDDEAFMLQSKEDGDDMDKELAEQIARKRKEIRVAEEVVSALNARARELEEKIAAEEKSLRQAKEQAELKKQDRAFYPLHVVSEPVETPIWSPILPSAPADPHFDIHTDLSTPIEVFSDASPVAAQTQGPSPEIPNAFNASPRPRHLSLGSLSNFHEHAQSVGVQDADLPHAQVVMRLTTPDDAPLSSTHTQSTNPRFSPFGDQELEVPLDLQGGIAISPRSTSLIPTSLIRSIDSGGAIEDLSRSFQSENDAVLDRNWRKLHPFPIHPVENPTNIAPVYNTSPTSLHCLAFDAVDKEDPFEIRPPPPPLRHRLTSDGVETERAYPTFDFEPLIRARTHESASSADQSSINEKAMSTGHRRWFSSHSKEQRDDRKGLNPEAKVFQFRKTFPMFGAWQKPSSSIDSMISQPSSTVSSLSIPGLLTPSTTVPDGDSVFSTVSMRAFAPSPEEREALTRAMGIGSANTSLERLPTLSEVVIGSLPSSPNHVHAIATQHSPQHSLNVSGGSGTRSLLSPGFSWLHSLPKMKKPKFSPWDDDEASVPAAANSLAGEIPNGH